MSWNTPNYQDELARGVRAIVQNIENDSALVNYENDTALINSEYYLPLVNSVLPLTSPYTSSIWAPYPITEILPSMRSYSQQYSTQHSPQYPTEHSKQYQTQYSTPYPTQHSTQYPTQHSTQLPHYAPTCFTSSYHAPTCIPQIPQIPTTTFQTQTLNFVQPEPIIRTNMLIPPTSPISRYFQMTSPQMHVHFRYRPPRRRNSDRYCVFCFNNNEIAEASNHLCRDDKNRVTCPKLYRLVCPNCGSTGEFAHTIKYCPHRFVVTPEDTERIEFLKQTM